MSHQLRAWWAPAHQGLSLGELTTAPQGGTSQGEGIGQEDAQTVPKLQGSSSHRRHPPRPLAASEQCDRSTVSTCGPARKFLSSHSTSPTHLYLSLSCSYNPEMSNLAHRVARSDVNLDHLCMPHRVSGPAQHTCRDPLGPQYHFHLNNVLTWATDDMSTPTPQAQDVERTVVSTSERHWGMGLLEPRATTYLMLIAKRSASAGRSLIR